MARLSSHGWRAECIWRWMLKSWVGRRIGCMEQRVRSVAPVDYAR